MDTHINQDNLRTTPQDGDTNLAGTSTNVRMNVITREQLNLSPEAMTAVIPNDTLRFVIPVPATEGKPFVEPEVMPDGSANPTAGAPLNDWRGNPIEGSGVVFYNFKDKNWAAVKTDGTGIVIFNSIDEDKANMLEGLLRGIVREPSELTAGKLQSFLDLAAANGFGDRYNSDVSYAQKNLLAHEELRGSSNQAIANYGLHSRTKDVLHALYLPGEGISYHDGSASPQLSEDSGLVVVLTSDNKTRAIQPRTFAETYRLADGSPIDNPQAQLVNQSPKTA